jgi:L-alanine-DL-glutamate epimerase-like enolase superfamily enzyme
MDHWSYAADPGAGTLDGGRAEGFLVRITSVDVISFETSVQRISFGELLSDHKVVQTVTTIRTDEGLKGHYFGGHFHGDQDGLLPGDRALISKLLGPILAGNDPLDRERIWQQLWTAKLPENVCSVIDLALWDLAGRMTDLPVHMLLGRARERVKAYASSFNNLGMPDDYAAHAITCRQQGYRAYKIHPYFAWDPRTRRPTLPKPAHVDWDIQICRVVRDAVGDDMVLIFDPWGSYNHSEALRVGRELERLHFYWYEHPMPEHHRELYVKLAGELDIPICSPEIAEGGIYTRADWIRRGASDISRIDVLRGGITGATKLAAACDAFGLRCELHMSGFGNLQVLGATTEDVCEYYERGLLGPGVETMTLRRRTSTPHATPSTPTATSPSRRHPASATTSNGATSTITGSPKPTSKQSRPFTHASDALSPSGPGFRADGCGRSLRSWIRQSGDASASPSQSSESTRFDRQRSRESPHQ